MNQQRGTFSYDWRSWLFSFKTFAAAMCALYIGFACGLPRPYWSMATVYIVSHPIFGPTSSKGIYRIGGTLLGAAAAVIIVPNLVNTPVLFCLAMAGWLSVCLFFSMLDRTPRSYLFMLAGYTAGFIGFPSIAAPVDVFTMAVSRSEEIILGALCATLAASLVFPESTRTMVVGRIDTWMKDASVWLGHALLERGGTVRDRRRMAADMTQFDQLSTFIGHDDYRHPEARERMAHLRARMLLLLTVLSALGDRCVALSRYPDADTDELRALLRDVVAWTNEAGWPDAQAVAALRQRVDDLRERGAPGDGGLLLENLLLRLLEFIEVWSDCRSLREGIAAGTPSPLGLLHDLHLPSFSTRHRDYGMVCMSVGAVAVAILAYCAVWIGTGWVAGVTGAMMAAVAASFFAAQDTPWVGIRSFLVWAMVSLVVIALYLFVLLPRVVDFGMLMLVLGPAFLLFGLLMSKPQTLIIGMSLGVNSATLMGLGDTYHANYVSFANNSLAMICGIAFVEVMIRITRPMGAEWSVRRLYRHSWQTLTKVAEGQGKENREVYAALMLDRLSLLNSRLVALRQNDPAPMELLGSIRAGLNIVELRRARFDLEPALRARVEGVLGQVAAYYRDMALRHDHQEPPEALLADIRQTIDALGHQSGDAARDAAKMALLGLRFGLKPILAEVA